VNDQHSTAGAVVGVVGLAAGIAAAAADLPVFALVAAVAALVYALVWESYLDISGYDFMADYTKSVLKHMQSEGASAAAIQAKAAELNAMAESYKNPLFRVPMTFVEIFPVGLLVALVSAALLRNPKLLPARQG